MRGLLICFIVMICSRAFAQNTDSIATVHLQEITVTAYKDKPLQKSSVNISSFKLNGVSNTGNFNLTDRLAQIPGVSMLSTGLAITKPVVRGLYGNRVLVLLSGLKFDNQQWQEEHGLGLSDIGLRKIELIKGPISVLYGSEAIGGIINLVENDHPPLLSHQGDVSIKTNSNTLGGLIQGGYSSNTGDHWWRLRAGIENNADYSDGDNSRVLNSRFDGYYLKTSYGFRKKNWVSTNNFSSSFNRYGFIFEGVYSFIEPDARWSRDLSENPVQLVLLNILSSENKITLNDRSNLSFNVGVQSNERMENEGGGAISLNIHLLTLEYLLKWELELNNQNRLVVSNLSSFEKNSNFGARTIVPDANMQESNVSGFIETTLNETLIIENGIGVGEKLVRTFLTKNVNDPNKENQPFRKLSPYYNAYTGFTYLPSSSFNLKFNAATGVRIPNLAELSSDGLHEGIFTYEIGDPNLRNEQIYSLNTYINYQTNAFKFSVSPFVNFFTNYVYLTPTNEEKYGFPVYRYRQQNAKQYGTEASLGFKLLPQFYTEFSCSGMSSKTADGNYTPFLPAQKLSAAFELGFMFLKNNPSQFFTDVDYNLAQNNTAPFELATPDYWLLNMGVSSHFIGKSKKSYDLSITANNVLNEAYTDHLSRFKYLGLQNIGFNLTLNFKINFVS